MADTITAAEMRWGIRLTKKNGTREWCGRCPFPGCDADDDGFLVWEEGNYLCRKCGAQGWVDENDAPPVDQVQRKIWELEREQRRAQREREALARQQAEHEQRIQALEQMAVQMHVVLSYFNSCLASDEALGYWHKEGMSQETIEKYALGYCHRCPTDYQGRPSYTIPVVNFGRLRNIRHRLVNAPNGDKYRPHMAGLPATLFNADFLRREDLPGIIIAEGEKKSIILDQHGFPSVAIMGKSGFKAEWARHFHRFSRVYVTLDPDATSQAAQVAANFGRRGYVVELPVKADDFFTAYKGTPRWFQDYLDSARRA